MESYALSKTETLEFSPKFLSTKMIDAVLKLDVSGVSSEDAELAARELERVSVRKLRATLKKEEMRFEPEPVKLDGVSIAKNEAVESIVDKIFKYAEQDKDIGRDAVAARFAGKAPGAKAATKAGITAVTRSAPAASARVDAFMNSARYSALQVVQGALSEPVEGFVDHANQKSVGLTRSIHEGKIWYSFGAEPVLAYKVTLTRKSAGDIIGIVIKWVSVVFDIFSIIASLVGVIVAAIPAKTFKQMTDLILKGWKRLKDVFKLLGDSVNKSSKLLDGAKKVFEIFKSVRKFISQIMTFGSMLWKAVKIFLFNLRWWEVLICVVSFIASLVILIATAGTGLIAKLVVLAAQFAILATDIASAVIATV